MSGSRTMKTSFREWRPPRDDQNRRERVGRAGLRAVGGSAARPDNRGSGPDHARRGRPYRAPAQPQPHGHSNGDRAEPGPGNHGRPASEPGAIRFLAAADALPICIALQHNHNLMATRTAIEQSRAQEITAGLRPNPVLSGSWQPPSLFAPEGASQVGLGLSNDFELGKRGRRIRAARDATNVTRSQVGDSERGLAFQVASQFINVQLAESTLELAQQNLKSFQNAVEISEFQYGAGGISENDYLKVKLQMLQFETDVQQAQLARAQALTDLRQLLGYESVPPDYDVTGRAVEGVTKVDLKAPPQLAHQH